MFRAPHENGEIKSPSVQDEHTAGMSIFKENQLKLCAGLQTKSTPSSPDDKRRHFCVREEQKQIQCDTQMRSGAGLALLRLYR